MDLEYRHKDGRIFTFAALVKDYGFVGIVLCGKKVVLRPEMDIQLTRDDAIDLAFKSARSL